MDLNKLEGVIRPVIESFGVQLYDVEFLGRTLRVAISKPHTGVTVGECAEVSRLIGPLLDVEDVVPGGRYDLEVSSPGLDRHLRKQEHFESAVGEVIELTTIEPVARWNPNSTGLDSRKKFKGELIRVVGQSLYLTQDKLEVCVPIEVVRKAHVEVGNILNKTSKEGSKNGNR